MNRHLFFGFKQISIFWQALSKKHPALSEVVDVALDLYAAAGESSTSLKIPRQRGLPVFKDRLAYGNQGKSGAARIVYYCDSETVVPLLLFAKSKQEDVSPKEIRDALKSAGLL